MNQIKSLFGQTAVYGAGTVVPRLLNYVILTPFFTRIFELAEYGVITELYAYVVFLMIILTYGMETGFFRFAGKGRAAEIFNNAVISLGITSSFFILLTGIFSGSLAGWLKYGEHPEYIVWIGMIVGIDAFCTIPFAKLRFENKAVKFAAIRITGVVVNIGLNFIFLYVFPRLTEKGEMGIPGWLYNEKIGVGYVFISNLASSVMIMVLLGREIAGIHMKINRTLWKKMLVYSLPLLVSGLAGMINEAIDRILLRHLLPAQENPLEQLGIYGANFKIAVIMTLYVQMFRYASEPMYFKNAGKREAKKLYAGIMNAYVASGLCLLLMVILYLDIFKYFIGPKFREGLDIVPIILLANFFLGIFFNLSVWYKIRDLTKYGALLTGGGALVTILINAIFIPEYGYHASAWAHLICYAMMVMASFLLCRKFYRINYDIPKFIFYLVIAGGIFIVSRLIKIDAMAVRIMFHSLMFLVFVLIVLKKESFFKYGKNEKTD